MFPSPLANSLIVWNNPTKQVTTEVTLFYKEYWNSWIYDSWDFRQISSTCILFYLPIFSLSSYTDVTSCQYALDFFFSPWILLHSSQRTDYKIKGSCVLKLPTSLCKNITSALRLSCRRGLPGETTWLWQVSIDFHDLKTSLIRESYDEF